MDIKRIIIIAIIVFLSIVGINYYNSAQSTKNIAARQAETDALRASLPQPINQQPTADKAPPTIQPQESGEFESLPVVADIEPQVTNASSVTDPTALADKAKLDNARLRWVDTFKIAISTPRVQLNEEIKTLQAIKFEVITTEVGPCMSAAKAHLAEGMSITIDGLLDYKTHTDTGVDLFTESTTRSNKEMAMYNSMSIACVAKL